MKKLVLMLAVAFSVSMFSCGNGNETAANDTTACDSCDQCEQCDTNAVDTAAVDTAAVDTVA